MVARNMGRYRGAAWGCCIGGGALYYLLHMGTGQIFQDVLAGIFDLHCNPVDKWGTMYRHHNNQPNVVFRLNRHRFINLAKASSNFLMKY
jgi:hypothetical protein